MLKRLAILAALAIAVPATAQEAPQMVRQITVSATGEAERVPDTAIMSFGVVTEGKTAGEAFKSNNEAASRLVEGLKQLGIEQRHITTQNISIQPRYDHSGNERGEAPRIAGYTAENQVEVRFTSLTDIGAKLDEVVSLGANRVSGPQFIVSNPEEAEAEARRKALENALAKARTYAEAGGFSLGEILQIEEGTSYEPPQPFMMRAEAAMDKAQAPVEAGTRRISVNVRLTVAIQ